MDHEAKHPRRVVPVPQRDNNVPNLADLVTAGVKHGDTGKPGYEDPPGCAHNPEGYLSSDAQDSSHAFGAHPGSKSDVIRVSSGSGKPLPMVPNMWLAAGQADE